MWLAPIQTRNAMFLFLRQLMKGYEQAATTCLTADHHDDDYVAAYLFCNLYSEMLNND